LILRENETVEVVLLNYEWNLLNGIMWHAWRGFRRK